MRARDAHRKSDLQSIGKLLKMWSTDTGQPVSKTGGGYAGLGRGWYSFQDNSNYKKSIENVVFEAGYTKTKMRDPKSDYADQGGYMVYPCYTSSNFALVTRLEVPSQKDKETVNDYKNMCPNDAADQVTPWSELEELGMNYALVWK